VGDSMNPRLKLLIEEYKKELEESISDPSLREIVAVGIVIANEIIDWDKVRKKYNIRERRSLLLKIVGRDRVSEAGFVLLENGKAIPYTGIEKVDVEIVIPEEVFWAIIAGKISIKEAWLRDLVKLKGDHPLRDALILIPLFETIRKVIT